MANQRRLLLILTITLFVLLLVVFFGPDPKTETNPTLSEYEIAQWTIPSEDTGNAEEDVLSISSFIIVPTNPNDPYTDYYIVAIVPLPQDNCTIPETEEDPVYY